MKPASRNRQEGITLVVGLILLVLITVMVTTAFTLNTNNLKTVSNMQFRNESIAAAHRAIEFLIGNNFASGFTTLPNAQTVDFYTNNDSTSTANKITVSLARPVCRQSIAVAGGGGTGFCGGVRAGGLSGCGSTNYNTLFEITASVSDSVSGAQITMTQGVRMEITETQKAAVCPTPS